MVKTEHLMIAGAVGVAGIIGFALLSPEEKEKLVPFPIGGGAGGIDLSGFFAGFKFPEFPEIKIPEFPSLAGITAPVTNIIGGVTDTIGSAIDTAKEAGKVIVDAPKIFGENIVGAIGNISQAIAEGLVTVSPFGFGAVIGEKIAEAQLLVFPKEVKFLGFPSPEKVAQAKAISQAQQLGAPGRIITGGNLREHPLNPFRIAESVVRGQARGGGGISVPTFAPPTIKRFKERIAGIEAGRIKAPALELETLRQRVAG